MNDKPVGRREIGRVFLETMMVVDTDGYVGDIHEFLDSDGEPTDDADQATVAIVRWKRDGRWSPVEILESDRQKLH